MVKRITANSSNYARSLYIRRLSRPTDLPKSSSDCLGCKTMYRNNYPEVFDELRSRLSYCVAYDGYLLSKCPFHSPDKHPSFFVRPDYYYCKSCDAKGATVRLLERLSGVFIPKATSPYLNPWGDWQKRFGGHVGALQYAYQTGKRYPHFMKYVLDRGITTDSISKLKLGYLDGFITVPVFRDRKVIGATTRMIEGEARYFNPKAQNPAILFIPNESLVEQSDHIYLVFGIFDCITLYQYGLPVMTTLTGLYVRTESFEEIRKKIIVIPDRGEEKKAAKLVARLGWRGKLKLLDYPIGTKDINDLHRNGLDVKEMMR